MLYYTLKLLYRQITQRNIERIFQLCKKDVTRSSFYVMKCIFCDENSFGVVDK